MNNTEIKVVTEQQYFDVIEVLTTLETPSDDNPVAVVNTADGYRSALLAETGYTITIHKSGVVAEVKDLVTDQVTVYIIQRMYRKY